VVGFSFFRNSAVMLKKAQSPVMLAALALLGALLCLFGNGLVQSASYAVGYAAEVAEHGSLPKLAESTAPSLPDSAACQTDNGTLPVTSGGAVEASFTVISRPSSDRGESVTSSTASGEGRPGSSPPVTPAQEENGAAGDQQLGNSSSNPALGVGPKSSGLTPGWWLLIGALLVVGIGTVGVLAICLSRAGKRFLRLKVRADSSRQVPVCKPGGEAT
jgi:hypothetical protein